MKIFTREEIEALIATGKNPTTLLSGEYATVINLAYTLKMDIKVDEVRQIIGANPHPDPEKGAKYIWDEEL